MLLIYFVKAGACEVLLERWQNPFQLERLVSLPHYFIRALDTKWQILVCIFACLHSFRKHIHLFLPSFSAEYFSSFDLFFSTPPHFPILILWSVSNFTLERESCKSAILSDKQYVSVIGNWSNLYFSWQLNYFLGTYTDICHLMIQWRYNRTAEKCHAYETSHYSVSELVEN